MIHPFDNQDPKEIFQNVLEGAVLLVFQSENTNQRYGKDFLIILQNFDNQCPKDKTNRIVWFLLPNFENEIVKNYWKRYNPNLLVPYIVFTKADGTNTNLFYEGVPSEKDLLEIRNIIF